MRGRLAESGEHGGTVSDQEERQTAALVRGMPEKAERTTAEGGELPQ
jgi:hypothetical protein